MLNQSVCIIEFPKLYYILKEIENLFKFNINNYENTDEFIDEINSNNKECLNSIILLSNKNLKLFSHKQIENNTILIFDELPITIEKLLDVINTKLIKKKYNFQSKFKIKNYVLNLNSRIIFNKSQELKLTEREIDIILFLNQNKTPQSVNTLQNKVWGHLFDLETHTVETHIYRLRKKIKEKFNDINFIISHDDGYVI